MADEKKSQKSASKIKKKRWCTIVAPKFMNEVPLGETTFVSISSLVGRPVKLSLTTVTGDIKSQNTNIRFVVSEVRGDKAHTELHSISMVTTALKRIVRRKRDKIEESFSITTRDNKRVRYKLIAITRGNTKHSVLNQLRKFMIKTAVETAAKRTFEEITTDMLNYKFQRNMRGVLKPIYPIKSVEVKYFGLDSERKRKKDTHVELAVKSAAVRKKLKSKEIEDAEASEGEVNAEDKGRDQEES